MPMFNLSEDTRTRIMQAAKHYTGHAPTLESAFGAVMIGRLYGWRVLKMIHNPSTYRKYEEILGLKFTDICPERTELSRKSPGLTAADKNNSFWAVVRGTIQVKGKVEFT